MPVVLEIPAGVESGRVTTTLYGAELTLVVRWSERARAYVVAVEDAAGVVLRAGLVLVEDMVTRRLGGMPAGALLAVRTSGAPGAARRGELGGAVVLMHYTPAELADFAPAPLTVEVTS